MVGESNSGLSLALRLANERDGSLASQKLSGFVTLGLKLLFLRRPLGNRPFSLMDMSDRLSRNFLPVIHSHLGFSEISHLPLEIPSVRMVA